MEEKKYKCEECGCICHEEIMYFKTVKGDICYDCYEDLLDEEEFECRECGGRFNRFNDDWMSEEDNELCYDCYERLQNEHAENISHLNAQYEADRGC